MDYYLGEIRIFAGNFAPANWALCQGQLLSLSANTALFSILGTNYGGNGLTTFALPDLRSRVVVGVGQGSSLSAYVIGQTGGTETVTLQTANLPAHTHTVSSMTMNCYSGSGNTDTPINTYPAKLTGTNMYATAKDGSTMAGLVNATTTSLTGAASSINLIQPVRGMNFIICINGDFPPR